MGLSCSPQAEDGGRISHLIALIALLGVVLLALVEIAAGHLYETTGPQYHDR